MSDSEKVGFEVIEYRGERTTVTWDERLCIHVGECGRASGDLFVAGRQPWCQPDMSTPEDALEIVDRCPTGAINLKPGSDAPAEQPAAENTIAVSVNGPLFARGELDIAGAGDDMPGVNFRAALCRCGQSANKPFCDNSHIAANFQDYGAVGDPGSGLDAEGGPVVFKAIKDGPLMASGNLSILSGSARKAWKGKQVALCRCGESANKPFCDGAHKAAGFKSD